MKEIEAKMSPDWILPYSTMEYNKIPVVTKSNHPRFVVGKRLDYGFLQIALSEGYKVTINQ